MQTDHCVAFRGRQIPGLMKARTDSVTLGAGNATSRFRFRDCWISGSVAARGTRAATSGADRRSWPHKLGRRSLVLSDNDGMRWMAYGMFDVTETGNAEFLFDLFELPRITTIADGQEFGKRLAEWIGA